MVVKVGSGRGGKVTMVLGGNGFCSFTRVSAERFSSFRENSLLDHAIISARHLTTKLPRESSVVGGRNALTVRRQADRDLTMPSMLGLLPDSRGTVNRP